MAKNKIVTKKSNNTLVNSLIIIGIVFLILSLALMFTKGNKNEKHLVEMTYSEYEEQIKKNEYTVILLTSPTCSHCVNYKPYVNLVAEENDLVVYDINLNSLEYDQYIKIHDKYSVIKDEYDDNNNPVISTPVTIIVKNGEEVTSMLGNIGQKGFLNLLKTNGVVK